MNIQYPDNVLPEHLSATCPDCGEEMWAIRRGQWTLRTSILKLAGDQMVARCFKGKCSGEVLLHWLGPKGMERKPRRRVVVLQKRRAPKTNDREEVDRPPSDG